MENFRFEPVVALLLLILIPLANYVLERMRRRFKAPGPAKQPVAGMGMRRQAGAPVPVAPSRNVRSHPTQTDSMLALPRRSSRRGLFQNQHDGRRAIVVMTVLGPCRAKEWAG